MLRIDWVSDVPPANSGQLLVVAFTKDDIDVISGRFGEDVRAALTRAGVTGKAWESFRFTSLEGGFHHVELIAVAELGSAENLRKLAFEAGRSARSLGANELVLDMRDALQLEGEDASTAARLVAEGLELSGYRYDRYRAKDEEPSAKASFEGVSVVAPGKPGAGIERGRIVAAAISRARDLGNGPAELVTPTFLAETASELAAELRGAGHDVSCEVFDLEECERRSMGLYLAVARGSDEPPKFIHLTYKPKGESKGRICLVGKGVTFDSGGYSLKPTDGMLAMKLDMGGAAAVIGAMEGIARLELPYEVHVISAAAENMVSGRAYRLGDVFRASNGKTVEINNTDAEGRLTLADALHFAVGLEPDLIVDFATLTGACIVALGPHIAGVMTRDDELASSWQAAGGRAGEDHWRLPLPKPLMSMLDSKIADMRNTGERAGGSLTAGLFLEQFVGDKRWMHVDIAGPAIVSKPFGVNVEGSSGFPVATILEFLASEPV
ncbi:leucyl aminopeptidase [Pseudenhygromyxa sp. WMMC2535]|uniref:leucyl aminopeptidase family protein n=1 Tax=Pseudenhygromyxa sp. WMMC2535 TaxID=2712867 RepID=UPI0015517FFB|nr:leucyl aminopeptidase [Pseudenhygromyxa sp. WMMC2535]NVB38181.1 leucyl aminopeptidase [Pseudenhygromyxa sp. WMMC2535]